MKRSEVNGYIREAKEIFKKAGFTLPPFASIPAEAWKSLGKEYNEIRENMLGWDLTDFGSGDFLDTGLLLVTMRNGKIGDPNGKTYAEKLMIVKPDQKTPMHFHQAKMEDIINRAGGDLMVKVYLPDDKGGLSDEEVPVTMDGITRMVPAGTVLRVKPGESITMQRRLYHSFWCDPEAPYTVVGEVSMVNDDVTDNYFLEKVGRFSPIEEDEAPIHLLCNEYPKA